ncbi:autotransporter outer membrane beta-barrel domain-containing protein [Paraburkholderia terrae]
MQVIWRHTSFDAKYDGLGLVDLGSASRTTGRIGLRGNGSSKPAATGYGSRMGASIYGTIGWRPNTRFGSDQIPLREEATRMEFAGGVTALLWPNVSIYAQAGYQFAVGDTDGGRRQGVEGDPGLRYASCLRTVIAAYVSRWCSVFSRSRRAARGSL